MRIKVILDEPADAKLLNQVAQEAIKRFPYFSVCLGLDTHGNYTLSPNDRPLPVLPEEDSRLMLGSEKTNGHLFAITWRDDKVYFNWAHSICGAFGAMRWIKTTLYQYMTKKIRRNHGSGGSEAHRHTRGRQRTVLSRSGAASQG